MKHVLKANGFHQASFLTELVADTSISALAQTDFPVKVFRIFDAALKREIKIHYLKQNAMTRWITCIDKTNLNEYKYQ